MKFQTFRAETIVSAIAATAAYQNESTGPDESQFAMLKKLELPAKGTKPSHSVAAT